MEPIFLGIDVGTSSAKVVATDLNGRLVAQASSLYPTRTSGQAAEQDAENWWDAVRAATLKVVAGREVRAVAVTSQAPTLVAVDRDNTPLLPALTWLDRRALAEAETIAGIVPESRNGADPFFGTAKLPWLREHRAHELRHAEAALTANGFIAARLTGRRTLDDSSASLMQGFDEATGDFDQRLRQAGLGLDLLPPIMPSTGIAGTVSPWAAAATGIPEGTPVAAGAIDAVGSALEAGAVEPGDPLVEMTGFSTVALLPVPRGVHVPGFIHARHCFDKTDLLIAAQVTAGATVDWVNALDPTQDLRDQDGLSRLPRPSRLTFLPSLAGERTPSWNPHARGIIDGIDLSATASDLMLAALEGVAMALAEDVDTFAAHGYPPSRIISTGGGAQSSLWLQIKSDVTGLRVSRPESGHGAALGASYLASLAVGHRSTPAEIRALTQATETDLNPDLYLHEKYRKKLQRFDQLRRLNSGPVRAADQPAVRTGPQTP